MKVDFLDLSAQHNPIREELNLAIAGVINKSQFIKSSLVREFEKAFANYLEVQHLLSCGNGTDALELALNAFGIGQGDEVIVPAMSWISTSEVVVTAGAKPVFVDIDENSNCIDTSKIEEKVTSETKAIIPVHLYGHPANMPEINRIAKKHSLLVIEDCAQAHGAEINGKKIGTFGDAATFSFFPTKNLGAFGDAGAVIFKDEKYKAKASAIANHGQIKRHQHSLHGRNSRMDGLQAAVLLVKLQELDRWNKERLDLAKRYHSELKNVSSISLPEIPDNELHVFHLFVIGTEKRNKLKLFLANQGIQTMIHYPKALPFQPCYSANNYKPEDFPIAYDAQQTILSLPFYPGMSEKQVTYVCDNIKEFKF